MQQLISHLLNICDNVYRQNAFVYICSQIVLMLYYTASHCLIFLIFCIFRLKSSLMSKTLSNFDFEIFDFTSTFPDSPTSFPVWCFPTWRSRQTLSLSRFETPKHNQFMIF